MRRLALSCLVLAVSVAFASAGTVASSAASLSDRAVAGDIAGLTNDGWQHSAYMVTAEGRPWYGAAADVRPDDMWLDGVDDQHEVALTVYSDVRYGETDGVYGQYPTFALVLMRSSRERLSVNLRSHPASIHVVTLSTSAPADDQNGRYVYPKDSAGATLSVAVRDTRNLSMRSAGVAAFVYNRDSLRGKPAQYADGVPRYTDWPDTSDADGATAGHWVYRWDAFVDGVRVDSAWLDSPTGRVKLESNKRHPALPPRNDTTYVSGARLATSGSFTTQPWSSSVPTTRQATCGAYRWQVATAYTDVRAKLPLEPPHASFVRYSNPVAYELKSLLTTRFQTAVDKDSTQAELSVKCPTGTKYLFRGTIPRAGETFAFPAWDGFGPKGERLPSAIYDWTLKLTKDGSSSTYTGKISVSRIWFTLTGASADGTPALHTAYMVTGSANCYVSATTAAAQDTLGVSLAGPAGLAVAPRTFPLGAATPLDATSYYRGASAPKARGTHTWTVDGGTAVSYRIVVIQ